MASEHEPHFLKPLLPGFYDGVTIPLAFYSKHIEGKPNQGKWTLRSDASHKTWEVKQEGRRLTGGWKAFAKAHSLRIGDIVVFKKEGDMIFHMTPFGRSFTEIQYTQDVAADGAEVTPFSFDYCFFTPFGRSFTEIQYTQDVAADGAEVTPFSFDYCFLAEVTPSNLSEDKLHLPVEATMCTALNKHCREAKLVNKEGKSWSDSLQFNEARGMFYIGRGLFCVDNRSTVGDLFVFNVVGDGETSPLLCVCPERKECTDLLTNYLSRKNGASTSSSLPI